MLRLPSTLETLWIRDLTITMGLVDAFSTPRPLEPVTEGRLSTLPSATHIFPVGDKPARKEPLARAA